MAALARLARDDDAEVVDYATALEEALQETARDYHGTGAAGRAFRQRLLALAAASTRLAELAHIQLYDLEYAQTRPASESSDDSEVDEAYREVMVTEDYECAACRRLVETYGCSTYSSQETHCGYHQCDFSVAPEWNGKRRRLA